MDASHLPRRRQPRAARCRLLVIVMRARTVACSRGSRRWPPIGRQRRASSDARRERDGAYITTRERPRRISSVVTSPDTDCPAGEFRCIIESALY
ncbi:unnamed protein product [Danaus chrysippus]|uniref:(African queen) hypothetical protein n=1 Tax=Danaus chrysippus TaxID=151541 RepID=A0A8J2QX08_9NEOP|nr:unnamed protein product [Danaus chrysippus]